MSEISLNTIVFSVILYLYSDIRVHKKSILKRMNVFANGCLASLHGFFRSKKLALIFEKKERQGRSALLFDVITDNAGRYKTNIIKAVQKQNPNQNDIVTRNIADSDLVPVREGLEKKSNL